MSVIGMAGTGSGKTFTYLLPLVYHVIKNKPRDNYSPMGLVLVPTRELA